MTDRNPYAPPSAPVHDVALDEPTRRREETLVPYGRRQPLSHGLDWIVTGWTIFRQRPGLWILTVVVGYAAFLGLSLIPMVNLIVAACSPLLTAAFAALAHASYRGELTTVGRALGPVREQSAQLLLLGISYVSLWIGITLLLVLLDDRVWIDIALGTADPTAMDGRLGLFLLYALLSSVLGLLIAFAPALIALNQVAPLTAMSMSLTGALKNLLPGILCGFALMGIIFVSMIPLFLGLLVTMPLLFITIYAAYRDIFLEPSTA